MPPLCIGLVGVGLVGGALLRQISQSRFQEQIRVVALGTSRFMRLASPPAASLRPEDVPSASSPAPPLDLTALANHVAQAGKELEAVPVIVDCTASEEVAKLYPAWMEAGISVVTPNKKGFSSDFGLFSKIRELRSKAHCYHEATVGAGLPILSTLEDLVDTGDEIVQIEGIFSGTLSFLFNSFSPSSGASSGARFSEIVKEAKAKGYTEPDPRDDLNGLDMARKVVILGRLSGLPISLDTLPIENIVPESLRSIATAEEFLEKLPQFDDEFAKLNAQAAASQQVLRYVGVINPKGGSSVALKRYPFSHPFASLKGSDNIIAFTTKRYPNPMVIQGAGAGAEVTAAGVFGDLLKILRGRK